MNLVPKIFGGEKKKKKKAPNGKGRLGQKGGGGGGGGGDAPALPNPDNFTQAHHVPKLCV